MQVIERFRVPSEDDDAFRSAWEAEAPPGHTLHRALRADAPYRFVSLPDGPLHGALLITDASADLDRLPGRQGFIRARVFGELAAVEWSSPLMYQRAVQAGLALPGTLYVNESGAPPPGEGAPRSW